MALDNAAPTVARSKKPSIVMMSAKIHPELSAYEAAVEMLHQSANYVYQSALAWHLQPQLAIDGVDGALSWPMTLYQSQQLAERYAHHCILPATCVRIANKAAWTSLLQTSLLPAVQKTLGVTSIRVGAVYSHLCVDAHGSSASLTPRPNIAYAFGTLLITLPASEKGGTLTVARGSHSTTQCPSPLTAQVLATFSDATITSAPITSRRRVVLVYALVAVDGDVDKVPPTRTAALAALTAIAERPPLQMQRIGVRFKTCNRCRIASFSDLGPQDATLVDALLATGRFDVALVQLKAPALHYGEKRSYIISKAMLHPASSMPSDIAVTGHSVDAFVGAQWHGVICCALVFWPTSFRTSFVGLDLALRLATAEGTAGRLGLSVRDLVRGTVATFARTTPPSRARSVAHLVVQSRDVDLVDRYLRDVMPVTTTLGDMATTVHTCLHAYGWTTIYPALEAFLERWLTAREVSGVSHLVMSLAGIFTGVTALCPPLRQPFVGEFVKMCWQHLLKTTTPPMQHWILVDAYLMDKAPQLVRGNWLDVRLPPVLVGMVDGFLYGRSFASALARKQVAASKQLQQLPFGLVQAIASHPTLPRQRYLDVLATSINELVRTSVDVGREKPQAVSSSDVGNIMDAMHRLGCINAALLTACRVISSPECVVAGLLLFLQLPAPPLLPSAQSAIAHFVKSAAPTFHYTDHTQHDDVLSSLVDVIEVLTLTAPREVLSFVTAWCAALPETLDATRSSLYPVVEMLYSRFQGKDLDLVVHLAGPCLAALLQGGALTPVPALNDFVLTAIDVDADHCDECAAFGVFLLDGHCMEFRCEYDDGPCKALEELVKAYPRQLLLDQVDGSDDSASDSDDERSANFFIWKRAQPGGATIDDLLEYLHRSAQRQGDIARVAVLDEVLALHAAVMDVDAPAPKRPRHET